MAMMLIFDRKEEKKGDEWIKPEKTLFMQDRLSNVKPVVLVVNWRFREFSSYCNPSIACDPGL